MKRKIILVFILVLFSSCFVHKKSANDAVKNEMKAIAVRNSKSIQSVIPPEMFYHNSNDALPESGHNLFIYNSEIMETQWGPLYGIPIIFLFDNKNNLLTTYSVQELINDEFFGGSIEISYNNERNSFDLIFSFGGYGDYGTAYVDLSTYEIVRGFTSIPVDE